jgi:hypothetical protein
MKPAKNGVYSQKRAKPGSTARSTSSYMLTIAKMMRPLVRKVFTVRLLNSHKPKPYATPSIKQCSRTLPQQI